MGGFVSRVVAPVYKPKAVQKAAVKASPKGPTTAEMQDDYTSRKLALNRRGRRALILTSTKGVDQDVTLSDRSLLG